MSVLSYPPGDPLSSGEVRVLLTCGKCGRTLSWRSIKIHAHHGAYREEHVIAVGKNMKVPNFLPPMQWTWQGAEQKWHCGC